MDNSYINKYDEHFNVKEMTPESYRALFENSVQGIYQSTPQGRLIMVNPRLVEILGYSSMEELLKLDMAKDLYFYPDERERLTAKYLDYYQVDIKWKKKDGSPIFVRVHGRTIKDIYNKIIRYEAMVEDITEKKLLEEAKKTSDESFRLIFENALEGIYKSKVDGSIVMANPAFVKMLGYKTVDEVLKLNFINDIYFDAEARKDVIILICV
jgi:PAS domain S-box-containing protein